MTINWPARGYSETDFIDAWKGSYSIAECAKKLSLKPTGGNYLTLKNTAKELNLNTDHMKGQAINKGKKFGPKRDLDAVLVYGKIESSGWLRKRLIAEEYFEPKCYSCNLDSWLDNPIPLELDHINGDRYDNRIENLTLLCPNCHAFTPTYRGRNIKTRRKVPQQKDDFQQPKLNEKRVATPLSNRCIDCSKEIGKRSTRCNICFHKHDSLTRRAIDWPSVEYIRERLLNTSYLALAKELGVSDNAIRKYLKRNED